MAVTQEQETLLPSGLTETPTETANRAQQLLGSITASDLANAPNTPPVTPPVEGTAPDMRTVDAVARGTDGLIQSESENAKELERRRQEYAALSEEGTLADFFTAEQERMGIPTNLKELQDIQLQLASNTEQSLQRRVDGAMAPGQTLEGAQRSITREQIDNNVRNYGLAARAAVLQGNIETASSLVNQAVTLAYQDRTLRNQNLINQINDLRGVVDKETEQLLAQEQRKYEEDRAHIERVQSAVDTAIVSGAATAEETNILTQPSPERRPDESNDAYLERVSKVDEERYQTALSIVSRKARQDYNLERAIQNANLNKLNLEIDSINQKTLQAVEDAKNGILTEEQFEIANDLRAEVNGLAEVKDAKSLEAEVSSLLLALDQGNGVGDIAAINSFQRLVVDPGVAVREGDVALLQTAQSWTDRTWLEAQGLWRGDKLTPVARAQMEQLTGQVYDARVAIVDTNTEQIRTIANQQGIDYGKYIGKNFQSFYQIKANIDPEGVPEFGVTQTTDDFLDTVVNSLSNDPMANPFGVDLSE